MADGSKNTNPNHPERHGRTTPRKVAAVPCLEPKWLRFRTTSNRQRSRTTCIREALARRLLGVEIPNQSTQALLGRMNCTYFLIRTQLSFSKFGGPSQYRRRSLPTACIMKFTDPDQHLQTSTPNVHDKRQPSPLLLHLAVLGTTKNKV